MTDEPNPLLIAANELRDIQTRQLEVKWLMEDFELTLRVAVKPAKPKFRLIQGGKSRGGLDSAKGTSEA